MPELESTSVKAIAMGRDREPALEVIMHRVAGALRQESMVVRDHDSVRILRAAKESVLIEMKPYTHCVYYSVGFAFYRKHYRPVLSGRLYSDGCGKYMGGRVDVIGWDRSSEHRHWQADLFDTFSCDSDWLLNIEPKAVRPEIVTAVLTHIAAQSIRPL